MASTLFDTLLPVITQSMAQAGPAALQGHLAGQQTAQELALKQLELQLMQQRFPLEVQQLQADVGYKKALGTEAEARAKMYSGGLYPPGNIKEKLQRDFDEAVKRFGYNSPQAQSISQELNRMQMAPLGGPVDRQQLLPWLLPYIQSGGQIKPPGLDGHDAVSRQVQALFSQMLVESGQPALKTEMTVPGEYQGSTQMPGAPPTMPPLAQNRIDYATQKKAELAFMPGGVEGRAVRSFSTIIHHGNTLLKLVDALDAGDLRAVNRWSNLWSTETGGPAVTNFDAARKVFADEVSKAIIGGATALGDREANANSILALSSPSQLRGAIQTYMELASGQLDSYKHQYEATTHRKDFDRLLIPEARQKLQLTQPSALERSPAVQKQRQKSAAIPQDIPLTAPEKTELKGYYELYRKGEMKEPIFRDFVGALLKGKTQDWVIQQFIENLVARGKSQ